MTDKPALSQKENVVVEDKLVLSQAEYVVVADKPVLSREKNAGISQYEAEKRTWSW